LKSRINTEVAKKLFREIAREWKLTPGEAAALLGGNVHVDSRQLTEDELLRISYISGIYGSLQILFADEAEWRDWIRKPNHDWEEQSAMELMVSGKVEDLKKVRSYLASWSQQHNL